MRKTKNAVILSARTEDSRRGEAKNLSSIQVGAKKFADMPVTHEATL